MILQRGCVFTFLDVFRVKFHIIQCLILGFDIEYPSNPYK